MIKAAFDVLHNRGFICRTAFPGNAKAAATTILQRAQERFASGHLVSGCVFFALTDIKNGTYPVYFPAVTREGLGVSKASIGELVLKTLRYSGVYAEWDGDPKHPIIVKEN
jgi:hypothetical protein